MPHASLGTDHRIPWNPQPLGQAIGRLKANPMDIQGQAIRILLHPDNGVVAVGLVNAHSTCRPDPMGVEEDHNLANHFLGGPGLDHPLFTFRTNAVEVRQAFGRLLNDIKHLFAKGMDQFLGKVRANAFDHPRAEILFNAFQGARRDHAEGLRLELQTMGSISHPDALPLNVLARGNRCRGAYDGHQVTVTTDLDSENTEAGLLTMEGDTLHGTGQLFCGMRAR